VVQKSKAGYFCNNFVYCQPIFITLAHIQGAANKSNPLPCFVNISTTNRNFYKKIYTTIYHSFERIVAELY